jgi:hypothetical protein
MKKYLLRTAPRRLMTAAFVSLAVLSLADSCHAQQIGYVLDMSGDWFLNGSTRLQNSSSLPAGGVIRTNNPTDGNSFIIVVNREGNIIARKECKRPGDCSNPLQLPQFRKSSITSAVIDSVLGLLGSDLSRYVPLISRGEGLSESVLKLEHDQIDLSGAFKDMSPGDYFIRFERHDESEQTPGNTATAPLAFRWDATRGALLRVNGLSRGLYTLRLVQAEGDRFENTPTEAWVLVSDANNFDKLSNSFNMSRKLVERWTTQEVGSGTVRSFLRASLERLAGKPTSKSRQSKGKRRHREH